MSTAVAAAPAAPASIGNPPVDRNVSPRQYTTASPPPPTGSAANQDSAQRRNGSISRHSRTNASPDGNSDKSSPRSIPRSGPPPQIKVKKEPGSPSLQSARHRPKRLDLSSSASGPRVPQTARPSAPLTSRESAGLAIQDVGLACLSPGFQTNDPGMRSQLQRSLDVRDQQRQLIEARQKRSGGSHEHSEQSARTQDTTLFGIDTRAPQTARRKGPPPGLSISAPSAAAFASDRVIQSAPINQTFTGLRHEHPYTRHAQHGPSQLSQTSHIHNVPATQNTNRLPPISDVFSSSSDRLDPPRGPYPSSHSPAHSANSNHLPPPVPSPSFPPTSHHHAPPQSQQHHHHQPHHHHQSQQHHQHQHQQQPQSGRAREFRSADEAVHGLASGREDLLPKLVHYGGVQPPTPPSPMSHNTTTRVQTSSAHRASIAEGSLRPDMTGRTSSISGSGGRRRTRDEYERDNASPPSSHGRPEIKRTTFTMRGNDLDRDREDDWRHGMNGPEKREEFLRLCERAWDLFHS